MKFYISGKMRGIPDYNYPAFNKAHEALTRAGYEAYNPTWGIDTPDLNTPDTERFTTHIDELLKCDAVAVLMGWATSEGAKLEVACALATGKEIHAVYPNRPPSQMLKKLDNINIVMRAEAL
jgi:hypothetical protein